MTHCQDVSADDADCGSWCERLVLYSMFARIICPANTWKIKHNPNMAEAEHIQG